MKDVRQTHIGGRTPLIEAAGWRLLTDRESRVQVRHPEPGGVTLSPSALKRHS